MFDPLQSYSGNDVVLIFSKTIRVGGGRRSLRHLRCHRSQRTQRPFYTITKGCSLWLRPLLNVQLKPLPYLRLTRVEKRSHCFSEYQYSSGIDKRSFDNCRIILGGVIQATSVSRMGVSPPWTLSGCSRPYSKRQYCNTHIYLL